MSISHKLMERLHLMNMDERSLEVLRGLKPVIVEALPGALDKFYAKVQSMEVLRRFFSSQAMIEGAKNRQRGHWHTIADGHFDDTYMRAVASVGEIHARIGLEPRWYIGGYALLTEGLIRAVVQARWPRRRFGGRADGGEKLAAELGVLVKATFLDMEIAISVYLEALEKARLEIEEKVKATNDAVIGTVSQAMAAFAAGDLTYRIGNDLPAEYASLRNDYNAAATRLGEVLSAIQLSCRSCGTSIEEIAFASDDLARRTEQQAANLLQATTALNELNEAVKKTAQGAADANGVVAAANKGAAASRGVVNDAGTAMGQIESSSQEIGQIIGLIDDIAFQTNLLALNAGVEAARAGDAGRGFAVVASEVRALAQRSAEAAKAIKTLISNSSSQVGQGVDLVRRTGEALEAIGTNVAQIEGLVSGIAGSAQHQAHGLGQVSDTVNQMNQVLQQNAAMVEETTAATHSLKSAMEDLNRAIAAFKVSHAVPPRQAAPVKGRKLSVVG